MLGRELIAAIPRLAALLDAGVAWLATYALHSTALILAAWLITHPRAPWRVATATRDIVWKGAIIGGIITASLQLAVDAAPLGGTWQLRPRTNQAATEVRVVVRSGDQVSDAALPGRSRAARVVKDSTITDVTLPALALSEAQVPPAFAFVSGLSTASLWVAGVALLWFLGAAFMLVRYDRARSRLDRALSDRTPAGDGIAGSALREAMRRAAVRRPIRLTSSEFLESPAVIASDEICVPRRFLREVNVLEQETIFAHELAHVIRRDSIWLKVSNLVVHLFFFQPLNRLARARLIEVAEFSADELAVRTTGAPLHLARALAAVASWLSPATRLTAIPAMASARSSVLVRRVSQLTSWQEDRPAPRFTAGSALALAGLLVAGVAFPRFDLSNQYLAIGAHHVVFQQKVERDNGVSGMQMRVVDLEVTDTTRLTGAGSSRNVFVRRIAREVPLGGRDLVVPRRITVYRTTSPATSD